jgi:hypothetical protein
VFLSLLLSHLAAAVVGQIAFLLAVVSILDLASLVVRRLEAILAGLCIDLLCVHGRELLGGCNVVHLLEESLGEDKIDLFQCTTLE